MNIPNALLTVPRDPKDYIRGISSNIEPIINVQDGNWTQWLPTNEPQKYKFDTNECTQLSAINICETQMNWLKFEEKFSQEALDWFTENGYFDSNGSFAFSERFAGIMSSTSINGNNIKAFWDTVRKVGLLPRTDLYYTIEQSNKFQTQEDMCKDYYNPAVITQAMKDKALKSLSYINVQYEWISEDTFQTSVAQIIEALKQAPVHIGVPVCLPNWNLPNVPFCSSRTPAHCIELYDENSSGFWLIRDHYYPYNKALSKDYYIPQAILGVISVKDNTTDIPPQAVPILTRIIQNIIEILTDIFQKKVVSVV